MPITPSDYNDDAIKGQQLSKLMGKEILDRLKGGMPETLAHVLCVMAAEIDALKAALAERNLGDRTADSVDAQELKVGGVNALPSDGDSSDTTVAFSQASSRGTVAADFASGSKLSTLFGKIRKWFADLKTVAFTGSYNDLSETPNLADYIQKSQTSGLVKNDGSIDTTGYAPANHASSATTYGRGTSDAYGHVKVSNATLHSDTTGTVGIACGQGHKHDQYLTSHQQVSDYDETLSWGTRSEIAKVGDSVIHVTMPSKPSVIGQTVGTGSYTKTLTADELQFFVLELTETDFGSFAWGLINHCKFSIVHVLVMFDGAALSVPIQMSVSAEYVLSSGVVASDSSYQTTLGVATFMYTMAGTGYEIQKITLRFSIPNSPFSVGQKVGIVFDSLLCL